MDLVGQYYSWYSPTRSDISIINGGQAQAPAVGDVISESQQGDANHNPIEPGHTAVVTSVNINGSGNGTVMIVEQNVAYWSPGWNADGTQHSGTWPDDTSPYTKLQVSGWSYYDADFATPSQHPLYGVKILHFGTLTYTKPAVNVSSTGQPNVFAHTSDNHIDQAFLQNGTWSGWYQIGDSTPIASAPALIDIWHVYSRGTDNQIKQTYWTGSAWSPWTTIASLSGGFAGDPVAVAATGSGDPTYPDLYAIGTNGHIYHSNVQSGTWTTWQLAGGSTTTFH